LSKAKRSAQVVVCSANLHNIGVAANTFQASYGRLPVPYHLSGPQYLDNDYLHCYPFWIQEDDSYMTNGKWKKYGTSFQCFMDMGAEKKSWLCPSQKWIGNANQTLDNTKITMWKDYWYPNPPTPDDFGGLLTRVTYAYIAGVNLEKNTYNKKFKDKQPRAKFITNVDDKNPSGKVMGGDMVSYNGKPGKGGWAWTNEDEYYINHTVKWGKPYAQNILYGDSSVKNTGSGPWQVNNLDKNTWTYAPPYTSLPWFYFEGTDWYSNR
jgi:hypothetical protein